jgi:ligand-binding SRPBCC domain-containing protein
MSRARSLHTELWLPLPREEAFAFFGDAHNLEAITPPILRFQVLTPKPIPMAEGTLIDYRLRLRGVPIRWRTLISAWEPPFRFVDEQLRGPYRLWRHEHTFHEVDGGTQIVDHVDYDHAFGGLVERWLVRPDLERIFSYREQRLRELLAGELAA